MKAHSPTRNRLIVGVSCLLVIAEEVSYPFQNEQMRKKSTSWEEFAEVNNFAFVPGQFLQDKARVEGKYGGYHIQLSLWTFGIEIILTVVNAPVSFKDKTLSPITPEKIHKLLIEPYLTSTLQGYFRADNTGQKFFYHELSGGRSIKDDAVQLQYLLDLLSELADNYRRILAIGGEAIPTLRTLLAGYTKLPTLTLQLLCDIEYDTKQRLGYRKNRLRCPQCLTRCTVHKVNLPSLLDKVDISYHGCRICGQSREFFEGLTIAILDEAMELEQCLQPEILRVNWLKRRQLFDFDKVVVIRATDEDVERFAVQVGNDTDPLRTSYYRRMNCSVALDCRLSENTFRVLRRMFGEVKVTELL